MKYIFLRKKEKMFIIYFYVLFDNFHVNTRSHVSNTLPPIKTVFATLKVRLKMLFSMLICKKKHFDKYDLLLIVNCNGLTYFVTSEVIGIVVYIFLMIYKLSLAQTFVKGNWDKEHRGRRYYFILFHHQNCLK